MKIVLAAWLLLALVSTLARGSPTGVTVPEGAWEPESQEGRKIDSGSKPSNQAYKPNSKEAVSSYPDVLATMKGDERQNKPTVIVLQNDNPAKGIIRKSGQEKVYINNKAVDVQYVNKNSLPKDHPLRRVVAEKQVRDDHFSEILHGLFEIIQDIFTLMTDTDHQNALEKSDTGAVIATDESDRWTMTTKLFLKYLRLLKKSHLFEEFREVIPVTELENALENGDHVNLVQVLIKSITPGFFSFVCGVVKDLMTPIVNLRNNIGSAELREYIPSSIDLLWPVRFFARQTLGLVGHYFSRRELVSYWDQFRSYNPFVARSLEYVFPAVDEQETSLNSLMVDDISGQQSKSILDTALDNPYLLLAGVGSTVMVSLYAYSATRSDATDGERRKRSALEGAPAYPWNTMTFSDLYKIISAVESNPYGEDLEDSPQLPGGKPKKISNKKYISSHEMKKEGNELKIKSVPRASAEPENQRR